MTSFGLDRAAMQQAQQQIQSAIGAAPRLEATGAAATLTTDAAAVHPDVADALTDFVTDARTLLHRGGEGLRALEDALQRSLQHYTGTDLDVRTSITGADNE